VSRKSQSLCLDVGRNSSKRRL